MILTDTEVAFREDCRQRDVLLADCA
jgi:hypothetical protein